MTTSALGAWAINQQLFGDYSTDLQYLNRYFIYEQPCLCKVMLDDRADKGTRESSEIYPLGYHPSLASYVHRYSSPNRKSCLE